MHKALLASFLLVCLVYANKEPDANPSSIHEYENAENRHGREEIDSEESRIVQDVYSPDYYEPNIILDYRYLKTGGRRYTRGDGGQILVLPKRNGVPIPHNDFDSLLEYLRLKREADLNKILLENHRKHKNGYEQHLDTVPGLYERLEGPYEYEQQQYSQNPHRG